MAPPKAGRQRRTAPSFSFNRETILNCSTTDAALAAFSTEPEQNGRVYLLMRIVSDYKHIKNEPVHIVNLATFGDGDEDEEILPVSEEHPENACRCWFTFTETVPIVGKWITTKVLVHADITIPLALAGQVPKVSMYRAFVHHEPGEKGEPVEVRRVRRMEEVEMGAKVTEKMTVWIGRYLHWLTKPISKRSLCDTIDGLPTLLGTVNEKQPQSPD